MLCEVTERILFSSGVQSKVTEASIQPAVCLNCLCKRARVSFFCSQGDSDSSRVLTKHIKWTPHRTGRIFYSKRTPWKQICTHWQTGSPKTKTLANCSVKFEFHWKNTRDKRHTQTLMAGVSLTNPLPRGKTANFSLSTRCCQFRNKTLCARLSISSRNLAINWQNCDGWLSWDVLLVKTGEPATISSLLSRSGQIGCWRVTWMEMK